jgi:colanic acid/amylovoran biosynthesis glycosyltransferase
MKLAIFVNQFPVLSQTFVLNQVEGLINAGIDVTVIALSQPNGGVLSEAIQSRTVYLLKEDKCSFWLKLLKRTIKVVRGLVFGQNKAMILSALHWQYGHHARSLLLPTIASDIEEPLNFDFIVCHFGTGGVLVNELRHIGVLKGKVATIFHGFELSVYSALEQQKNNYLRLFKETELMLPISNVWKNKLHTLGCPLNKIAVHRMGVDLSHFTFQNIKPRTSTFSIFTVARFSEKKGLAFAIRSLALLKNKVKFHYTIAGFGELRQSLQNLVTELGLNDSVSFVGAINSLQVKEYMLATDVFLQPSITADNGDMEGVPVAIMEAMAMGRVIVSTFHSGIPELIIDNEHGLLAEEKDVEGLAEKIHLLYNNDTLQQKLAIQARKRIEELADVEKLNRQLVELLSKY